MKNGDFFNKIKRLRLNVTKFHRHVFENLGWKRKMSLSYVTVGTQKALWFLLWMNTKTST